MDELSSEQQLSEPWSSEQQLSEQQSSVLQLSDLQLSGLELQSSEQRLNIAPSEEWSRVRTIFLSSANLSKAVLLTTSRRWE